MSKSNGSRLVLLALALAGMLHANIAQASGGPILFVVPARGLAVKFAQDIATLRSSFVVSYQNRGVDRGLLLHVWDGQSRRWIEIEIDQYRAGSLFASAPATAVFMGTEAELPGELRKSKAWTARDVRLPTFNMAENVNRCHRFCNFQPREWRWLAKRYNLELDDRNADRRRYGRYGPPGQPPKRPTPRQTVETEVQTTIVEQPVGFSEAPVVAEEPEPVATPPVDKPEVEDTTPDFIPLKTTTSARSTVSETQTPLIAQPAWTEEPEAAPPDTDRPDAVVIDPAGK